MLDKTIEIITVKKKVNSVTNASIKLIYVLCAKTYIGDMLLYEALATPLDDIFYQDIAGEDWSKLLGIYTAHEFADNRKVVKAYRNFYSNVAIGNAVLSK